MADLVLPAGLAIWDPLGGTPEPLMTGHDGICVHTMAGTFTGTDAYFHQDGWSGTESTVGIAGSGFCKQWVPWNRQADANLQGNPRWLSAECADYGEGFPPSSTATDESPPLTDAQIDRIIRLCVYWCDVRNHQACPSTWQCHREGIPARFINNSCDRGIGTHYHGIEGRGLVAGCPRWSDAKGKICPRMVRHRQVRDIVVPEVARRLAPAPPPLEELMKLGTFTLYNPNNTFWLVYPTERLAFQIDADANTKILNDDENVPSFSFDVGPTASILGGCTAYGMNGEVWPPDVPVPDTAATKL